MKILEVIPALDSGGAEVFLVNLSNELAQKKNVDITILTLYPVNQEHFLVKKISPKIKLVSFNKKSGVDLNMIFQAYKHIRKEQYDIAHFHVNAIIYAILSVLMYRKCKYFATIHNDAYKEADGMHRYVRKFMFKRGLMFPITISNESDRSFRELYKRNASLIYNGVPQYERGIDVDLNSYRITLTTKVFLNVASIQPSKNQLAMARVVNRLAREGHDVKLLIIGRMTDMHKLCAEELKKEASSVVHLLGEKSNPRDYMIKSDYFILASHYEGLPITLLESLSVGCIPVVTAVGGNIDVVKDGDNGYIIENPSEEAIYTTIKRILSASEAETNRIREGVQNSAVKYSIENCADKHLELFKLSRNV